MQSQSQSPPTQETDYDADVEVVQPYSIEEPDEEPTNEPRRPVVSCLPDNFERWHVDLIESMDDLQCESDANSLSQRSGQKRGQKRKPAVTTAAAVNSSRLGSEARGPDLGRKRARRRIRRSRESTSRERPVYDSSSTATASNGSESVLSSSSARPSTEASGTDTGNMNSESTTDKMDMD